MGRPGRLRAGAAGRRQRWAKGRSSDCNPRSARHRRAARARFFAGTHERSELTVEAVQLHDELQGGAGGGGGARSEASSRTFLSGLSDCASGTFGRVRRLWESRSAAHKEICAVLAAVTEVIRAQGGKETETEYFAALLGPAEHESGARPAGRME